MQNLKAKNILIIGGTGIVGKPTVMQLIKNNEYNVYSIALEKVDFPSSVKQYVMDRTTNEYSELIQKLNQEIDVWEAIIDIVAFNEKSAESTYVLLKNKSKHIITLSTCLVYDRTEESFHPIKEDAKLATEGKSGGYIDGKVRLEKFWHSIEDVNWTILRPYHILGVESLLGCIPEHNRDAELIDQLKNGKLLRLCNGGNIVFNYIHPKDIATTIYKIINNINTFKQAYNLVNPQSILAKDYYTEIAKQINGTLNIETISMDKIWSEMKGWEMTTLPHIYSMDKMQNDIDFTPSIPLSDGIRDAIEYPAKILNTEIPVHQRMNKLPLPNRPKWLK